ncbi:hypothetical protein [uncultured Microbacterium sp.]|uniref:hypothetical protein n=1 Tax=uncultured Microbacterium sp. TaxID=191216 RepID=UPI0026058D35|nr:hypothetical protein [uncultured Microbacterium sp.]
MTSPTVRGRALSAALVLATALTLTSCGTASGGTLASDTQIAAACPSNRIATTIGLDGTSTFQSGRTKASTLRIVDNHVRRTAICGGHLRVFFFASSTGATVPLFDGDLAVDAPTENAKLRKAGKLADQTSARIAEKYDTALESLTGNGTDVLGMLSLLSQTNVQYPDLEPINVLLTDGLTNIDFDISQLTSTEAATKLADQQPVPDLSGADVSLLGIGKQAGGEIPSSLIAHLTTFWERICHNTGAAQCHVSTESR